MTNEEPTKDLKEYLEAIHRRKLPILIIAILLFGITASVAYLLPPVYRSTATILIEEQEIPMEMVRSTITTYAWQRIQTISQRVMTRATLMEIVDKYGLYAKERKRETTEEIIGRIRKDIALEAISSSITDRSGQARPATIAFTLSFEGNNPALAQKVASELTTLYLNENLKSRTEKASEAVEFLNEEGKRLGEHIGVLEAKVAEFKERNLNRLPGQEALSQQIVERTDTELRDVVKEIRQIEDRRTILDLQLSQLKPTIPTVSASGENILDPQGQLKALKNEYVRALATYSEDHPDVTKLNRQIEGLEKKVGKVSPSQEQAKELTRVRSELTAARERYSPEHPDVKKLERELAALESALTNRKPVETSVSEEQPDNPAYIQVKSAIESDKSSLKALRLKQAELRAKLNLYERRLEQTPQVTREYQELLRDYDNSTAKYRDVKAKQMEAEIGQSMEKGRKGERFTLIDPAQMPEKPVSPNRVAILILGAILSMGGGIGYAAVAEGMDGSVRGIRSVRVATGHLPLAVIPWLDNSEDRQRRKRVRLFTIQALIGLLVAAIVLIQFFWVPWDVLWLKAMRMASQYFGG